MPAGSRRIIVWLLLIIVFVLALTTPLAAYSLSVSRSYTWLGPDFEKPGGSKIVRVRLIHAPEFLYNSRWAYWQFMEVQPSSALESMRTKIESDVRQRFSPYTVIERTKYDSYYHDFHQEESWQVVLGNLLVLYYDAEGRLLKMEVLKK